MDKTTSRQTIEQVNTSEAKQLEAPPDDRISEDRLRYNIDVWSTDVSRRK